jgi:hypothetical protein
MEWIAIWAIGLFVLWFFWQSLKFWRHATDAIESHTRAIRALLNRESFDPLEDEPDAYPGG